MRLAGPKTVFYWCASCGGCEEALLDLGEDILTVAEMFDFVFWPAAMDFKLRDVEALRDGEIRVSFVNGGIRSAEQEDIAHLLRKKSSLIVAFGSCAHLGGVPGLANFVNRSDIFRCVYHALPSVSNADGREPLEETRIDEGILTLPKFSPTLRPLDQVIDVDYYLPGCAPPPDLVMKAMKAIVSGELPARGAVLAPDKALCDSCGRRESRSVRSFVREFRRVHETVLDPGRCFLDQGVVCLGPATRDGCGERCIRANMPCRGCFGPTGRVRDQGARFLSAIASLIDAKDEGEIRRMTDSIADPAGIFYFYSLPTSILKQRRDI